MHLEKFQVDKIQNGLLSAIIHLDRPDIAEYDATRGTLGYQIKIRHFV